MTSPFEYKAPVRTSLSRVYLTTRISQCIVKNVDDMAIALSPVEKDKAHELPAPRHQHPPGPGLVSERDRGGPGAPPEAADLERRVGRGRRTHAPAEPFQDR